MIRTLLHVSFAVQCLSLVVPPTSIRVSSRQSVAQLKSLDLTPTINCRDTTRSVDRRNCVVLHALSDRQLQFWEDVDVGLDDIENFYLKQGQNIERIRQFSKRSVQLSINSDIRQQNLFLRYLKTDFQSSLLSKQLNLFRFG
jgi:hypothetical protein